ncbi:MAG: hypothetical protein KIT43_12990 [Bauldia sp.]|nr:hypothetical protein [Bauldia sp.]MCW5719278.1 hypothetical protein [Bauldia sp.]
MVVLLYIVLWIAQAIAAFEGFEVWWDLNSFLSVVILVVALFLGPIGGLFLAIAGFVGATEGWDWEWWQALLLVAPGLVLGLLMAAGGGFFALIEALRGRR